MLNVFCLLNVILVVLH